MTRALVEQRYRVRVLARNPQRLASLRELTLEVSEGDVLSRASLELALRNVDAVVHCAATVSLRPRERRTIFETNVNGTRNVLDAAAARDIRVIHTSSIACIGPTTAAITLDESSPPTRLDFDYPYASSKRESEHLALTYADAGRDVVVLNPGIMLGPDDLYFSSTEFVMRYLRNEIAAHLVGGGSFCDVRDVAAAYPAALTDARRGERYILAGINRSYGQVMEELRQLTGLQRSTALPRLLAEWGGLWSELSATLWPHPLEKFNLSVARWGALFNLCDSQKAEKELGYRRRSFELTLTDTVVDHLQRRAAPASTPKLRKLLERGGQVASQTSATK